MTHANTLIKITQDTQQNVLLLASIEGWEERLKEFYQIRIRSYCLTDQEEFPISQTFINLMIFL